MLKRRNTNKRKTHYIYRDKYFVNYQKTSFYVWKRLKLWEYNIVYQQFSTWGTRTPRGTP